MLHWFDIICAFLLYTFYLTHTGLLVQYTVSSSNIVQWRKPVNRVKQYISNRCTVGASILWVVKWMTLPATSLQWCLCQVSQWIENMPICTRICWVTPFVILNWSDTQTVNISCIEVQVGNSWNCNKLCLEYVPCSNRCTKIFLAGVRGWLLSVRVTKTARGF